MNKCVAYSETGTHLKHAEVQNKCKLPQIAVKKKIHELAES